MTSRDQMRMVRAIRDGSVPAQSRILLCRRLHSIWYTIAAVRQSELARRFHAW